MTLFQDKIFDLQSFMPLLHNLKKENKNIVFTNGCFDILHLGHVQYLEKAKQLGDYLIVGVNSDRSIQQIKGVNRPILNLESRMGILAGLASVDAVIPFEEETPFNLIHQIIPNTLVKGGDWKLDEIIGSEFVIEHGGTVQQINFLKGYSTTNIIELILKKHEL